MGEQWEAEQARVTRIYDRIAGTYDAYDGVMDLMGGTKRRHRLLARAHGATLEVGIGTGRNLEHYSQDVTLTGIDVSVRMLDRARGRAARLGRRVRLLEADVQALPFGDASFDTVAATCVFCSVADPKRGLMELRRVVRPDGLVLLLEHVRPRHRVLGWFADMLTPLTRRLIGPALNRNTERTVALAGLDAFEVRREGVWREMVCRPGPVMT